MADETEGAHERLKQEFARTLQSARTLRDQIRVEIHLAGLDAQDRWKQLEPQLDDVERFGSDASEAARAAASKVARSFEDFRTNLKRHPPQS
jgi:hypothetical protein